MAKVIIFFIGLVFFFCQPIFASQYAVSKNDACAIKEDGIFPQPITIQNYPGYSTHVPNFYKEKNVLYYVVNAESLKNLENEAFLWSWNCKTKKPKQMSKHNFAQSILGKYTDSTVSIEYTDKYHIFLNRKFEGGKGEIFENIISVYYRANKATRGVFSLEENSYKKFRSSILDRQFVVPCNISSHKGCNGDSYNLDYPSQDGYDFFFEGITQSGNETYANITYKDVSWGEEKYSFHVPLDLSTGKVGTLPLNHNSKK